MDFAIELQGGVDDGLRVNVACSASQHWPGEIHVCRLMPGSLATDAALAGCSPEAVAAAYRTYRRSDRTTAEGRRVYVWDQSSN